VLEGLDLGSRSATARDDRRVVQRVADDQPSLGARTTTNEGKGFREDHSRHSQLISNFLNFYYYYKK
jgi:hypothetical protein